MANQTKTTLGWANSAVVLVPEIATSPPCSLFQDEVMAVGNVTQSNYITRIKRRYLLASFKLYLELGLY